MGSARSPERKIAVAARLRQPLGVRCITALLRGVISSRQVPVDPETRLFKPLTN